MTMPCQARGFATALRDGLSSLRLTLFLLFALALTSIIGTVVQQNLAPAEYQQRYGTGTSKLFNALDLFDMYHSWWFLLLLVLLAANLFACSCKRFPAVWRHLRRPTVLMDETLERSLPCREEFPTTVAPEQAAERAAALLLAEFAPPLRTATADSIQLFAQKTPAGRLGAYLVHLSIIVIFGGAIIGSLFGFKAYVSINEGASATTAVSRAGKPIELGFAVRCDDFGVSFYDTGAPREFKSLLTILENGRPVPGYERVPVIVNKPLTYKGITFYQSSYGQADGGIYRFTVRQRSGGTPIPLTLRQGESARLPDGGSMHLLEATDEVSRFIPAVSGPAARIEVHPLRGESSAFIVFANYPGFDEQRGAPLIFTYAGADATMFTGLQVAKDPGVWVVWSGCLLMVAGCYLAFFVSHRRIWVRITPGRVIVAGGASKNQPAFERRFAELAARLRQTIAREDQ